MPTKSEAIKSFLSQSTHPDLESLYSLAMECQVNVAQDHGERIEGTYRDKKWMAYTDGNQTWKSFRIPYNAMSNPEYTDEQLKFDLGARVEGIGMTGWDWQSRVSRWVAFDFDSIVGHSDKHSSKLSSEDLKKVQDAACSLDWVTVRSSTSGKGLHLYVFLDAVPTQNHVEHSSLARAILSKMSSLAGFDFKSKVDVCGGNMWVWHRKMIGTTGLSLIKQGSVLNEVPANWKEHINVVKGVRKKVSDPQRDEKFDALSAQRTRIKLDDDHINLIKYLNEHNHFHWWDSDHHMLVTHTAALKEAHEALSYKGIFETETKATTTHNCFMFPMRHGAWSIRRYSRGCKEHPSWAQDGASYTMCYYNMEPTLRTASMANGGLEDSDGAYVFKCGSDAHSAALALGANVDIPPGYDMRTARIKEHKEQNRIIVSFPQEQHDDNAKLQGWLQKKSTWQKIFNINHVPNNELDVESFDDQVRHLITSSNNDSGWVINSDGRWVEEPLPHVKHLLAAMNLKPNEIQQVLGSSIMRPWTIVTQPFQNEYPGDRLWNRNAPQFNFPATIADQFNCPTWLSIFTHIGQNIDYAVKEDKWCKKHGVLTGAEYLLLWVASMIQMPTEPLPYLFMYSEAQETGKSTFHEALELLFTPGYMKVDQAMTNKGGFNAELIGTILCVIEEIDLSARGSEVYNRMKEWVTAKKLLVHPKYCTPYLIDNTGHFIQCANTRKAFPVFTGDTRVMFIHVEKKPEREVPKRVLFRELIKEASDFIALILGLEIPDCDGRLRLPVIDTADKQLSLEDQQTDVQRFVQENCFDVPGKTIKLEEFYERFLASLEPIERMTWNSKQAVNKCMPDRFPKGRKKGESSWHWGNISWTPGTEEEMQQPKLIVLNEKLVRSSS